MILRNKQLVCTDFSSYYCFVPRTNLHLINCVLLGLKGILDQLPRAHASEFRSEVSKSACTFGQGDLHRNLCEAFCSHLEFLPNSVF